MSGRTGRTAIRRRDILTAAALFADIIGSAVASRHMHMGWLSASTFTSLPGLELLSTYLLALGWRAGETLDVVGRQAEGDMSRLPSLAEQIVAANPKVIACTVEASALSVD